MIRPSYLAVSIITTLFCLACDLDAQSQNDNRREYVRSSSATKRGGRVFNESVGGQRMVRIARGPGKPADSAANNRTERSQESQSNRRSAFGKYDYPEPQESEQVTAFRQAANQPPQLRFPPNNRLAQCNCNGVPVPPQQLQFPQQPLVGYGYAGYQAPTTGAGFQAPTGFQPQAGFGAPPQAGYPIQAGIGVPQFNQTGGNWWTPFVTGSGYYTPLLNFRNMPQGTYLGQGIIGQPTAYVDGQPFRNLLRYISP